MKCAARSAKTAYAAERACTWSGPIVKVRVDLRILPFCSQHRAVLARGKTVVLHSAK